MTANPVAEKARSGDIAAITELINHSLHKHHITATTQLERGVLEVMLDHPVPPSEAVADFIYNGLAKLNISNVYETIIYGRQAGELFATWSQTFELKPRPIDSLLNPIPSHQSDGAAQVGERSLVVTFASEDGHLTRINVAQLMGYLGVGLLLLGNFCPIVSIPIVGTLSYFRNGSEEGIALIGLSIASVFCLIQKRFSWLYGTGIWALFLVVARFLQLHMALEETKSKAGRELAGNPFSSLANLAVESIQLQWGWVILFLGVTLVLTAAYLQKRKLDRQAFAAIGIAFIGTFLLLFIKPTVLSIQHADQANRAKQSEAKTYVGTLNRTQQAHHLEKEDFAKTLTELDSPIPSETTNYKYEITIAEKDMTVATGTAKTGGLKSYVGAVFLIGSSSEANTQAILCESESATQKPLDAPILEAGQPKCPSGSSNLDAAAKD
jgi:type IV pilus assembly protein PilA